MRQRLFAAGLLVFLAGFGVMAAGSMGQGNASAGGVIFIGPLPIVFGSGPNGWDIALGSVVIGVAMLVLLMFWGVRLRAKDEG